MGYLNFLENLENNEYEPKKWRAAGYSRLSRDDGKVGDSDSIVNQRNIIDNFVEKIPDIEIVRHYTDDGFTGTNFDRPDYKAMVDAVYKGEINCIIVKDLSRFGRNAVESTDNMDKLIYLGVRFISIGNNFDSLTPMNASQRCVLIGVNNVVNEMYPAGTSDSVRRTLDYERQKGHYIGSFPLYGYQKDPNDYHKLVPDEATAPIVKSIFDMFVAGKSVLGIAKHLNENEIPSPARYKSEKYNTYKHYNSIDDKGLWHDSTVRRILKNGMYTGTMVQGRRKKITFKLKGSVSVPPQNWFVVEGTHDALVDFETFEKAQELFKKHIRSDKGYEVDLFSGLVRCADCKRAMNKKINKHSYGTYRYYKCVTNVKLKKTACSGHSIRIDKMEAAVLETIRKMVDVAVKSDEVLNSLDTSQKKESELSVIQKSIDKLVKDQDNYTKALSSLYLDKTSGKINDETFEQLRDDFNQKKNDSQKKLEKLKNKIAEVENTAEIENEFILHFKKYKNISSLTREIVLELIDEILVHEGNKITIRFKFRDAFKNAAELLESSDSSVKTA